MSGERRAPGLGEADEQRYGAHVQEQPGPGNPPVLVVLAAGAARRFGTLKQLAPVGPGGQALVTYALADAAAAGFGGAVLVVRPETEDRFRAYFLDHPPALPVAFSHQTLGTGLVERRPPSDRTRPWGTAHAVLSTRPRVDGPFMVVNADDYYGTGAYRAAAACLTAAGAHAGTGLRAVVAYRLADTLSAGGGVSRAVCRVDAEGGLVELAEHRDVVRDRRGRVHGTGPDGVRRALDPDGPVSMNAWAFTPDVFDTLARGFARFVDDPARHRDGEFLLPRAVSDELAGGGVRGMLVPAGERAFGLTFEADLERVARRLADLTRAGHYPPGPHRAPSPSKDSP